MIWEMKTIFHNALLLRLHVKKKLSQGYSISFVDQLVGGLLRRSFYRVLAFSR